MEFSDKGQQWLEKIEELSLQPYDDQKGIKSAPIKQWCKGATIGYGYLIPQSEWNDYKDGIEEGKAIEMLLVMLQPCIDCINSKVKVELTQNQFDALVILAYNIGIDNFSTSSVLKMVNGVSGSHYSTLKDAWMAFRYSQGKLNQGLLNRRNAEWNIYSKNIYAGW